MGWRAFEDVRFGRITSASFLANIWRVYINDPVIDERYKDPERFIKWTYLTDGLKFIVKNIIRRMAGEDSEPLVLLKTTFGGGKSHTLLLAYHLLTSPQRVRRYLPKEMQSFSFKKKPAVVVFDGAELDPTLLSKRYGVRSLWAFLFHKLAEITNSKVSRRIVEEYNDPISSPGTQIIVDVLREVEDSGFAPVFLIDELPEFLGRLQRRSPDEARQLRSFLRSFTEAIVYTKYSLLLLAIPEVEMYKEENKAILEIIESAERVAKPTTIIGRQDAPSVLRQALIESLDLNLGIDLSRKYFELYKQNSKEFPEYCSTPTFFEKLTSHYPFHPQYVEFMYDKLASLPSFQGTRDVLRLTSRVLHNLIRNKLEGEFVLLSDLNIGDRNILEEFLGKPEFSNLRRAVESDLDDLRVLDEDQLRRGLPPLSSKVYSAILSFSVVGMPISVKEILLAVARPESASPHFIASLPEILVSHTSHVHRVKVADELRYVVKERANWRRLVERKSREIGEDMKREVLSEAISRRINKWAKKMFSKVYVWPSSPAEIEDNEKLKAILLDPENTRGKSEEELEDYLNYLLLYSDTLRQTYRNYRNSIVFFVPNDRVYENALRIAGYILAGNWLKEARENYALTDEDIEELNDELAKWRSNLEEGVIDALYRKVSYPVGAERGRIIFESEGIRDKDPLRCAFELLISRGKFVRELHKDFLLEVIKRIYSVGEEKITLFEIFKFLASSPEEPYLLDSRNLKNALASLVNDGRLVLMRFGKPYCSMSTTILDNDSFLPGEEALKRGLVVEMDGKYYPPPPPGCINPRWDAKSGKWICGEEAERMKEGEKLVEVVEQVKEFEGLRSIELTDATLVDLFEKLSELDDNVEEIDIQGSIDEKVSEVISFMKAVTAAFLGIEEMGYEVEVSCNVEIFDEDRLRDLVIQGSVRTVKAIRETLELIERFGPRRISYSIKIKHVSGALRRSRELAKFLDSRILMEKFRRRKFDATIELT